MVSSSSLSCLVIALRVVLCSLDLTRLVIIVSCVFEVSVCLSSGLVFVVALVLVLALFLVLVLVLVFVFVFVFVLVFLLRVFERPQKNSAFNSKQKV